MKLPKKFNSLFYSILKVLLLAVLLPAVGVVFYILSVDDRLLKEELVLRQRILSSSVEKYLDVSLSKTQKDLKTFADMHYSSALRHKGLSKSDLVYLQKENAALYKALAFIDKTGKFHFQYGGIEPSKSPAGAFEAIKRRCLQNGKNYVGQVEGRESDKGRVILIAVPVSDGPEIKGALIAEVYLEAAVAGFQEFFLGHNLEGGVFTAEWQPVFFSSGADKELFEFLASSGAAHVSKDFKFNGNKYYVSSEVLPSSGWTLYLYQPAVKWSRIIGGSKGFLAGLPLFLFLLFLIVILAANIFIKPVVEPLRALRASAEKISREDFSSLPVLSKTPDNEVGALASAFTKMALSVQQYTAQAAAAREELTEANRRLEEKVQERTRELSKAADALVQKERLAAIGEMASIISHEIKNPLAVITNSSTLIKAMTDSSNPKLQKQFNIIETEIKQANKIIEEVLSFVQTRAPVMTRIELNSYIKEILFSYPLPKGIKLRDAYPPEPVYVNIDGEEIKRALINVISNAVEVMPQGGELEVCVLAGRTAAGVSITDHGAGMGEDTQLRIFTPFFTTKARGTGLGLAVVKRAVTNNKGKIFSKSAKGRGTNFSIYFKRDKHERTN